MQHMRLLTANSSYVPVLFPHPPYYMLLVFSLPNVCRYSKRHPKPWQPLEIGAPGMFPQWRVLWKSTTWYVYSHCVPNGSTSGKVFFNFYNGALFHFSRCHLDLAPHDFNALGGIFGWWGVGGGCARTRFLSKNRCRRGYVSAQWKGFERRYF